MTTRTALRTAATAAAAVLLTAVSAAPALAVIRDDGDDPGPPISIGTTLILYVGIPLLLFLVITGATMALSRSREPRYRPGLGWTAAPVWFGGPERPQAAVADSQATTDGGGASARW